jgi:uncharacterized protein
VSRAVIMPDAPVWVLEEGARAAGSGPAAAIAGRLGLPFRRIGLRRMLDRVRAGDSPALLVSAGFRSGLASMALRARFRCRTVHCTDLPVPFAAELPGRPFDLLVRPATGPAVMPGGESPVADAARTGTSVIQILGPAHVVSPALLARARDLWAERLSHLPVPRVVVLLGGGRPDEAADLARTVSRLARARGGCVLASVLPGCAVETADTFSAGLSGALNLVYRHDEPGEDPTLGFLGGAGAVVAAFVSEQALSECCATTVPVFVVPGQNARAGRLARRLIAAGHVRPFGEDLSPWSRAPLDEAGRVAREIRLRLLAPIWP